MIAPPMAISVITLLIIIVVVLLILGLLGRGRF
jgi:Sec-independent protein translocase protein TatA